MGDAAWSKIDLGNWVTLREGGREGRRDGIKGGDKDYITQELFVKKIRSTFFVF